MAEVRVESTLLYHSKVDAFMKQAEIGRVEAIGHLVILWMWCSDNAVSGVLPKLNDWEIATTCKFGGDARKFVAALVESGFLDRSSGSLAVHDWKKWIPKSLKQRIKRGTEDASKAARKATTGESLSPSSVSSLRTGEETRSREEPVVEGRRKPPHVEFVDRFKAFYEAMVKSPFNYGRAQFVIADRLIREHGLEETILKAKILAAMCRDRATWFTKNGWADFSIEKLSNQWNAIIGEAIETKEDQDRSALRKAREQRERADQLMG